MSESSIYMINDDFYLKHVDINDLDVVQKVVKNTFVDTFGKDNTEENMALYIDEYLTVEKIKEELINEENELFFFGYTKCNNNENEDELVGYVKLTKLTTEPCLYINNDHDNINEVDINDIVELQRIYVCKNFQKRGFGRLLLEFACDYARTQLNKKLIWLGVWEENHNAIPFYKKLGFVKVGTHDFNLGLDPQTDYIFQKLL
eukprot:TRINITY_DN5504_c0_g1_i1.p1 TRINITY_DN5504_c0_g1~~TRINITY_DN5504_c0_g1_i1.p1  ORF type:complete len:203 (+),score=34.58 TRINITY_DN5504_c0_g1_i1:291-899(+)